MTELRYKFSLNYFFVRTVLSICCLTRFWMLLASVLNCHEDGSRSSGVYLVPETILMVNL